MNKVPAKGLTIKGVDISHWQPVFDFQKARKQGIDFAFLKATEGKTIKDKNFLSHAKNAKDAGVLVGAYHFYRPLSDAIAQAKFFADVMAQAALDLPPVFDWEVSDGKPGADDVQRAVIFLREIEKLTGKRPIVYTGPYFFQSMGPSTKGFEKYPLWVAHYKTKAPLVPAPWKDWNFWQFTDEGLVSGIKCDVNYFNGSIADLVQGFVK